MTTTDETAKALVNMLDDYDAFFDWMLDQITVGHKNYDLRLHLYLMACLWLMLPEIKEALESRDLSYKDAQAIVSKLKELRQ